MERGSKLFLILLFVGLTGNVFAMKREREGEGDDKLTVKKQRKKSENYLPPKNTIAFGVKDNKRKCKGDEESAAKRMKMNFVHSTAQRATQYLNNFIYKTPCSNKLTICLKNWWIRNISQVKFLDLLPKEIIKTILTRGLSAKDLARVSMTCTKLKTLAESIKLTKEWEAARGNLWKLADFIQQRGEDLKKYNLQNIFYACLKVALAQLKNECSRGALFVLQALVRQGQYYPEALKVALAKLNDENCDVRVAAWELLQALVYQGQYYPEVLKATLEKLNDKYCYVLHKVLRVLKALVKQGYAPAYNPAFKEAQAKLNDEDWQNRGAAWKLLQALVRQGQYYPEALKVALARLNDEDWFVRVEALLVLKLLVKQGQYYPKVRQAALDMSNDKDWSIRMAVLGVLHALAEQGQYSPEVLRAALDMLMKEQKMKTQNMIW